MPTETGTWDIVGKSIFISVMEGAAPVDIMVSDDVESIPQNYRKSAWINGHRVKVTYVIRNGRRLAKKVERV